MGAKETLDQLQADYGDETGIGHISRPGDGRVNIAFNSGANDVISGPDGDETYQRALDRVIDTLREKGLK